MAKGFKDQALDGMDIFDADAVEPWPSGPELTRAETDGDNDPSTDCPECRNAEPPQGTGRASHTLR
jgi:hypothetical protein